ncbi:glucose-1-phosphate thymidylyltransferase RfbA [Shewanella algae]|uniref:glucose-1-phosphate thymidylyltransferase RfbA n=1 Tax=Shewanella algae TaxID=38313 RepID=UPI001AACEA0B|nr:glucose-1-phosphate thymidylyltransferase RfbA [Shewanella algae]MBO2611456.1 glucose-1-phosphate thymidylyltransferase RfbA [Shewanella algae]
MKGIILAGGTGSRLFPITLGISKQLLPVFDKPLIYYPLSVLMLAGIREILIITTPQDKAAFERLLVDGSAYGIKIEYLVQPEPKGIAQALILAEDFLKQQPCCLILGDNIFYGQGFSGQLRDIVAKREQEGGATVFACQVKFPHRFGVITFDELGKPLSIEEKPLEPKSNWAQTGLYFLDGRASAIAKSLQPSRRGELEIVDLANHYLREQSLDVQCLGRGFAWLDTGTVESLYEASSFIQSVQSLKRVMVGCPEEIAWRNGWLSDECIIQLIKNGRYSSTAYGQYLESLLNDYAYF